jgi:hypothetical protein
MNKLPIPALHRPVLNNQEKNNNRKRKITERACNMK